MMVWCALLVVIYLAWALATPHRALEIWLGVSGIVIAGAGMSWLARWLAAVPLTPEMEEVLRRRAEALRCKRCGTIERQGALFCRRCYAWVDIAVPIALLLGLLGAFGALWWAVR